MRSYQTNFHKPYKNWLSPGYFYFLLIVLIFSIFLTCNNYAYAREINIVNGPSIVPPASLAPQFSMLQKIEQGIELLKKSPALKYENKIVRQKNGKLVEAKDLVRKQIALAILNKDTGEIFEKRVWVKEQDINNYKKIGVITLEPAQSDEPLDIEVEWWNSFNSPYAVVNHPELIVLADKYLFPSKYLAGLPEKSRGEYTDIIYAPYSKDFHQPEIIDAGKNYLEKNIDQAFAELQINNVMSQSLPNSLATADITKDFIRNIILVEHVDPDSFAVADDGGKELSERVLAVIGANQALAYRYTGSPAGASGLAQFIKSTYMDVYRKYPTAHLIKDYNAGMANHINAVKAMVLFFDGHKEALANKIARKEIVNSLGITEEMLAATYNGGPARVATAINKFGLAWFSSQLDLSSTTKILRQETLDYIKKFQAIKNLNLFANISGG